MPANRPRSEVEWLARTPGYRRRVERNLPGGKEAWKQGATLPRGSFGHSRHGAPSHGPAEAAANPERYPDYISKNLDAINAERRRHAQRNLGGGPRGPAMPYAFTEEDEREWGPYAPVVEGESTLPAGFHGDGGGGYATEQDAQNRARESNAPPGIVQIWHQPGGGYLVIWEDESGGETKRKAANARRRQKRAIARAARAAQKRKAA